ncbi:MAG: hypothetical protein KAU50_12440, partial [Candidatus Marinimicrobia bacterium]|nr:hypothetical protein [Candidatus Neomarinimicrobiota bacterium]
MTITAKPALGQSPAGIPADGLQKVKETVPPPRLRRSAYSTDQALTAFESLLIWAARLPLTPELTGHPLYQVQAVKALVGLRTADPSAPLINYAITLCDHDLEANDTTAYFKIDHAELGNTVAVHELEAALSTGASDEVFQQLGRLLLVTDNKNFLFDILLDVAARAPETARQLAPFIHYCQRAADFTGRGNLTDFLYPAACALAGSKPSLERRVFDAPLNPWEVLP